MTLEYFDRVFQDWWDNVNQPLIVFGILGFMLFILYLMNIKNLKFYQIAAVISNLATTLFLWVTGIGVILMFSVGDIGLDFVIAGGGIFAIAALFGLLGYTFNPHTTSSRTGSKRGSSFDDAGGKGYDGFNDGGGD
jgi:hypothetical protein